MGSFGSPWRSAHPTYLGRLLKITVTQPVSHIMYFSDRPISDVSILSSGASIGLAGALVVEGVNVGPIENGECNVVIANRKYQDTNTNPPPADDLLAWGPFANLLSYLVFHGAAAELRLYMAGTYPDAGYQYLNRVLITGHVENVTDITPSSITLRIVRDLPLTSGMCPMWTVGGDGPGSKVWPYQSELKDLPELSRGLPLPLRLGPAFYIPKRKTATGVFDLSGPFGPVNAKDVARLFPAASLIPARFAKDGRVETPASYYWAYQEQPGALLGYQAAGLNPSLYKANSGIKSLSMFAPNDNTTPTQYDTSARNVGFYITKTAAKPSTKVYLMPEQVSVAPGAGVTNWKNALDGKPDTWMKIDANGGARTVRFKIPQIGSRGDIAPVAGNIAVFVCTLGGVPPGESASAFGTFRFGIMEPYNSSNWFAGITPDARNCDYSGLQYAVSGGTAYPAVNLWGGTSWQKWEFLASGESSNTNTENRIYVNGYEGLPFDLAVNLVSGNNIVYISAIMLEVTFAEGADTFRPWIRTGTKTASAAEYIAHANDPAWFEWGPVPKPKPGMFHNLIPPLQKALESLKGYVPQETIDPEQTYVWHPGYHDTIGLFGTTDNGNLREPGSIAMFIGKYYGKPQVDFTLGAATTFGTVKYINAMAARWAKLYGLPNEIYQMFWWADEQRTPKQHIDALFAEVPGMVRIGTLNSGAPSLVMTSYDMTAGEAIDSNHASVIPVPNIEGIIGGLSCHDVLLMDGQNIARVEVLPSQASEIINNIEIHYQYDRIRRKYGAIAKCNKNGSDDGFGNAWPKSPSGQVDAATLAGYSYTAYGTHHHIIYSQYLWDPWCAVALGTWKLWRYLRPYTMVKIHASLACQDVLPGQVITFNNDLATYGKVQCVIPNYATSPGTLPNWTGRYYHVLDNTIIDPGGSGQPYCLIMAIDHISNNAFMAGMAGGVGVTAAQEGFIDV